MKHCAFSPDEPRQSENQRRPPGGRRIDELPRSRPRTPDPKVDRPKPISVALLKHSQRSFVRTAKRPKTPNRPNRKAPPPALLFLPITMSKNPAPKPDANTQVLKPDLVNRVGACACQRSGLDLQSSRRPDSVYRRTGWMVKLRDQNSLPLARPAPAAGADVHDLTGQLNTAPS